MKIRQSIHAQIRARERGVSVDIIKKVIKEASSTRVEHDNRIRATKIIGGRKFEVIYKKIKNEFVIITVI